MHAARRAPGGVREQHQAAVAGTKMGWKKSTAAWWVKKVRAGRVHADGRHVSQDSADVGDTSNYQRLYSLSNRRLFVFRVCKTNAPFILFGVQVQSRHVNLCAKTAPNLANMCR